MGGVTYLLLLLWAGVTVSTVLDLQKRIIGGRTCGKTDRLHHVELFVTHPPKQPFHCGGTLLENQWILTAAHCWEEGWTMVAYLAVHPGPSQPGQIITRHENFTDANGKHDIMLLKLPNPPNVEPASLPDCGTHPPRGATVQMAGHSYTNKKQQQKLQRSKTLQCVDTTVFDCKPGFSEAHHHFFCGKKAGVGACPGDSGSGVMYNGRIYGVIYEGDCNKGTQVHFMDVCNNDYLQWINRIIAT